MTSAWHPVLGGQAQWFGIRKPGVRASQLCSRTCDSMLQTYSLRLSWQLTLYIENLSFVFKRWRASQSIFSLPIWLLRFQSETYFLLIRIIYYPWYYGQNILTQVIQRDEGFSSLSKQLSHSSGNASLWIWKELRDIITVVLLFMWRILPWDSSPVDTDTETLSDTETLWTLWKTNVKEINVMHC